MGSPRLPGPLHPLRKIVEQKHADGVLKDFLECGHSLLSKPDTPCFRRCPDCKPGFGRLNEDEQIKRKNKNDAARRKRKRARQAALG